MVTASFLWRHFKQVFVFCFVVFHLTCMAVRNPLDLWEKPIEEWLKDQGLWQSVEPIYVPVDRWTYRYDTFCGIDQGWSMFGSPVARNANFLGARIEFKDGSDVLVKAENEPDPVRYWRSGGWRQRKLEDRLVYSDRKEVSEGGELCIWEALARWNLRRWRDANPDDTREPVRITLVRRRFQLPDPDSDPSHFEPPEETVIARFDIEGQLL